MKEYNYAIPKSIFGEDIKALRLSLKMSRNDFAAFAGVSIKTVENWELNNRKVTGPICYMYKTLSERPTMIDSYTVPDQKTPLRLLYYKKTLLCSVIDINESERSVKVKNYTDILEYRAFGLEEYPSYGDYQEFLKSRCSSISGNTAERKTFFTKNVKQIFESSLAEIERTGGRKQDDDYWIKVVKKR